MNKEIIVLVNIEFEKCKFHCYKYTININNKNDINEDKI